MGHRADQAAVLYNGATTHALHNAARCPQKFRVSNAQQQVAVGVRGCHVDPLNADGKALCRLAGYRGHDLCFAGVHFLKIGNGDVLPCLRGICQNAVHTGRSIGFDVAKGLLTAKFAPQLPRAARTAAAAAGNGDGNGFPGQQR